MTAAFTAASLARRRSQTRDPARTPIAVCTERTALAPSPTAAATRFIEPFRTSPTAKTLGTLVSKGRGPPEAHSTRELVRDPLDLPLAANTGIRSRRSSSEPDHLPDEDDVDAAGLFLVDLENLSDV